jgi:hypothetical protein
MKVYKEVFHNYVKQVKLTENDKSMETRTYKDWMEILGSGSVPQDLINFYYVWLRLFGMLFTFVRGASLASKRVGTDSTGRSLLPTSVLQTLLEIQLLVPVARSCGVRFEVQQELDRGWWQEQSPQ